MSKYLISKIAFIFFCVTTVIMFAMLRQGTFVAMVGSIEIALAIYGINSALLVTSIFVYIWQEAHKDDPEHQRSVILEAYAEDRFKDETSKIPRFVVDEDLSVFSATNGIISITLTEELETVHNGDIIQLLSPLSTGVLTVKVLSKQNGMMQLMAIH